MIDKVTIPNLKLRYIPIIIILVVFLIAFIIYHFHFNKSVIDDITAYLDHIYKIERNFIENIPIYEDYATPERELLLRKYLLNDHLKIAKKIGIEPIEDINDAGLLEEAGKLKEINPKSDVLYFLYNVKKENRYLTPHTIKGLNKLTERFQQNINKRKKLPPVKIAISSMLRTTAYQTNLKKTNVNASIVSTHSYGTSFDIFYDDYYILLPEINASNMVSEFIQDKLNKKFGFLLGDSLRRQFRSILMETLLQLQQEGILYAILEKNQRCYHITILDK